MSDAKPEKVSKKVTKPVPKTVVPKEDKIDQTDKTVQTDSKFEESVVKDLAEIKTLIKGFKKDLKGLIEIQQRLVHERLGAPVPLPPKEYGEETSSKSIGIELSSTSDNRIKISGKKSYDVKDTVKKFTGARFSGEDKSWSIPSEHLDDLIKNMEALNLVRDKDFLVNVIGNTSKKSNMDDNDDDGGFGSGF